VNLALFRFRASADTRIPNEKFRSNFGKHF
jgi:hypothetical protein